MPGYTRRYNIYIEGIDEKLNRFLEAKNVAGRVEHEFTPRRGSDFAGTQNILTGWATLAVETSDPNSAKNWRISFGSWKMNTKNPDGDLLTCPHHHDTR